MVSARKIKKRGRSRGGEETRIIVPEIATKGSKGIRTRRRRSGKGEDNCYNFLFASFISLRLSLL